MTKKVLVAYDGSPQAESALEHALGEHPDADLIALNAIDPGEAGYGTQAAVPSYPEDWYEQAREAAEETLSEAEERAKRSGVALDTAVETGGPANTVVEYAEEHDVDHIITGSHGRTGVSRILLGSVAETVIRRSPVPVTVVR